MEENTNHTDTTGLSAEMICKRVSLLTELLQCNNRMIVSRYDMSGALIHTNASETIYDSMLRYTMKLDEAIAISQNSMSPLVVSTEHGLMWSIVFEPDESGKPAFLHALGPVLTSPLMDEAVSDLSKNPVIRREWKTKLLKYLRDIKVLPAAEFFKDTLMLHYCVTGVYLKPSDIMFTGFSQNVPAGSSGRTGSYVDFWTLENSMMEFVRTGDIHYKEKIPSASSVLSVFQPMIGASLIEGKQLATIFCGLCIHAAIDGGISPDTAYTKSAVYLKNLHSITAFAEILPICQGLFEDLLFQVHNHQEKPAYSKEVRACIDYIETHPDELLSIDYLAGRIGYSKYYMSKKFKAETGLSMTAYIKKARIERASYLLVTTKMDIEDISSLLHFGNRNFFTKVFKEETGTTPALFRKAHKRH